MQEGGFDKTRFKPNKPSETRQPKETITPVFNKWILENIESQEDDTVKIDGQLCTRFVTVGQIIDHTIHNNQFILSIDDGTECIKIMSLKVFNQQKPKSLEKIAIEKFPYVQVVYELSLWQKDNRQMIIFHGIHFREVFDHNQITFHMLSCIKAKQERIKCSPVWLPQALGEYQGPLWADINIAQQHELQKAIKILQSLKQEGFWCVSKDALIKWLQIGEIKLELIQSIFKSILDQRYINPIPSLEDEFTILV